MEYSIQLHQRPSPVVVEEILSLVHLLTGRWFTSNVPDDTRRDLQFQDVFCLCQKGRLLSFLIFTSWDGLLYITLMGTHPEYQGMGLGTKLMDHFVKRAKGLGFARAVALTVPPDVKPSYGPTVQFYQKHGFVLAKRYTEMWEDGALELVKDLTEPQSHRS